MSEVNAAAWPPVPRVQPRVPPAMTEIGVGVELPGTTASGATETEIAAAVTAKTQAMTIATTIVGSMVRRRA